MSSIEVACTYLFAAAVPTETLKVYMANCIASALGSAGQDLHAYCEGLKL